MVRTKNAKTGSYLLRKMGKHYRVIQLMIFHFGWWKIPGRKTISKPASGNYLSGGHLKPRSQMQEPIGFIGVKVCLLGDASFSHISVSNSAKSNFLNYSPRLNFTINFGVVNVGWQFP